MAGPTTAYLVVRREDGFGDVYPLIAGQRFTLGRAATNRIVLKDELCSREHAEVYHADGRWRLRDLDSLNGTRVNGDPLDSEWELSPGDEVNVGRTHLIFVEDMAQLPDLPPRDEADDGVSIKKRLGQTRFLTPVPSDGHDDSQPVPRPGPAEPQPRPVAAVPHGPGHGLGRLLPGAGLRRAQRTTRRGAGRGRRRPDPQGGARAGGDRPPPPRPERPHLHARQRVRDQ